MSNGITGDSWILPFNQEVYRIKDAFNDLRLINWPRTPEFQPGMNDIVYFYFPAPELSILYKAVVTRVDITKENIQDRAYWINRSEYENVVYYSCLKLLKTIPEKNLHVKYLLNNGLAGIEYLRYPINISIKLAKSHKPELQKFLESETNQLY